MNKIEMASNYICSNSEIESNNNTDSESLCFDDEPTKKITKENISSSKKNKTSNSEGGKLLKVKKTVKKVDKSKDNLSSQNEEGNDESDKKQTKKSETKKSTKKTKKDNSCDNNEIVTINKKISKIKLEESENSDLKLKSVSNKVKMIFEKEEIKDEIILIKSVKKAISKNKETKKHENINIIDICVKDVLENNADKNCIVDDKIQFNNINELSLFILNVNKLTTYCCKKMIVCDVCKQNKNYTEFKESSTSSTGRSKKCLECSKIKFETIVSKGKKLLADEEEENNDEE